MTQEERIIKKVYDAKKVELGTHKVDLAITDDIKAQAKIVSDFLKLVNKADTAIQKNVQAINAAYKPVAPNLAFGKQLAKRAQDLKGKFDKMAKDLGVNVQGTDADKQLSQLYSEISQIDDSITNIQDAFKAIGKV
jgi:ABC-type nitrate/sulfonate/bicarbonate transport system substrate-binding protein